MYVTGGTLIRGNAYLREGAYYRKYGKYVCMYVSDDCTSSHEKETKHIIYRTIQNLLSQVIVLF